MLNRSVGIIRSILTYNATNFVVVYWYIFPDVGISLLLMWILYH